VSQPEGGSASILVASSRLLLEFNLFQRNVERFFDPGIEAARTDAIRAELAFINEFQQSFRIQRIKVQGRKRPKINNDVPLYIFERCLKVVRCRSSAVAYELRLLEFQRVLEEAAHSNIEPADVAEGDRCIRSRLIRARVLGVLE
jgi:hypothetical protein